MGWDPKMVNLSLTDFSGTGSYIPCETSQHQSPPLCLKHFILNKVYTHHLGQEYWLTVNSFKDDLKEIDTRFMDSEDLVGMDVLIKEKRFLSIPQQNQPCESSESYSMENCTQKRILDNVQPKCTVPGKESHLDKLNRSTVVVKKGPCQICNPVACIRLPPRVTYAASFS